jgi:hypothetical protein
MSSRTTTAIFNDMRKEENEVGYDGGSQDRIKNISEVLEEGTAKGRRGRVFCKMLGHHYCTGDESTFGKEDISQRPITILKSHLRCKDSTC